LGLQGRCRPGPGARQAAQAFPLGDDHVSRAGIMWSWLAPRGCTLINPETYGEAQDAILLRYDFAWIERRLELNGYEAFSAEIPDHATARLMQRAPNINLAQVFDGSSGAVLRN
jgi:hypothetical protein